MTDETKRIFDAPWTVTREEIRKDTKRYAVVKNNLGYELVAIDIDKKDAHRLARLPELYDALMHFVVNDCPHAFISNDECRLCPDKKCKTREAVELLRKVRAGE